MKVDSPSSLLSYAAASYLSGQDSALIVGHLAGISCFAFTVVIKQLSFCRCSSNLRSKLIPL